MTFDKRSFEVCFENQWFYKSPRCPHGPMLLFEKFVSGKHNERRYFACSASRNRKECSHFIWEDDFKRGKTQMKKQKLESHYPKYEDIIKMKNFCLDCQRFFIDEQNCEHKLKKLNDKEFSNPSHLLQAVQANKFKAQYHLKEKSLSFLFNQILQLGYTHVICMGMPRLHEAIQALNTNKITSFLLDIDERFKMFWPSDKFARFNMFNHYFFDLDGEINLEKFLSTSIKVLVVTDPPFGGLIECLNQTLLWFTEIYKRRLDTFLIFPYFFDRKINETMESFEMLDYIFEYDNHKKFRMKKNSPVRLFTNISLGNFNLPVKEGYRYCKECEKFVLEENKHCKICGICPSKNGKTYIHCNKCNCCVKPDYTHCLKCNRCQLNGHTCHGQIELKCHICGDKSHKRKMCPQRVDVKRKKFDN